jgi:hypothetical protein
VGAKLEILGVTVKFEALVAVPAAVVTVILPVVAPLGTVVVIEVEETTVYAALTPLNFTEDAPVNAVPVIVTAVPTGPGEALKLVMFGNTVKLEELFTVPPEVVTEIKPVVAFAGTVTSICVAVFRVIVALTPFIVTDVAPVRVVPLMVTVEPITPLDGEKLEIVGGTENVPITSVPEAFVTAIFPVVAPTGTVAVI